jgi:molybdate transport system ATP-binding protein
MPHGPGDLFLRVDFEKSLGDFRLEVTIAAVRPPLVILGPSGSGKSMTLRCIAGNLSPDRGQISVAGRALYDSERGVDVPPQSRRVGYVPQDFALFPHLSVSGNIAYGMSRSMDRKRRVAALLALFQLDGLGERKPAQLSSGQRQRVAIARALAVDPAILLLDEPFAALDIPVRAALMDELEEILKRTEVATVIVTQDRAEAMRLGATVAVMMDGRIRQVATPAEVFSTPVDEEVAAFVGVECVWPGVVVNSGSGVASIDVSGHVIEATADAEKGERVLVCLRPEEVVLSTPHEGLPSSARNRMLATVRAVTPAGPAVRVDLDAGIRVVALVTRPSAEDLGLAPGVQVAATFKATAVHLIPRAD